MPPATTTPAIPLLSLSLGSGYSLALVFNPVAIIIILLVVAAFMGARRWLWSRGSNFEIDKAEFGLGTGTISFKPNLKDQQIAYAIWVELSTRKIGLPIDLQHDVIFEIYDSWHSFFGITRELIKDIPVNKVKNDSTKKIITLSINVLNQGLRPHLTSWQARFRHWYEKELAKAGDNIDPQSIQAKYPKFDELKTDLMAVNQRLIKYREKMRELVLGLSEEDQGEVSEPPATPAL
jgi:hypothetical protein